MQGYLRILELEGVGKRRLTAALDRISRDFEDLEGFIIDIRDCPGGEDSIAIAIIDRFCDRRRVAFHRKTKIGPGEDDFTPLKTWYLEPWGDVQFTGPIALLTCDSVFSGGEAFALAIRQLPHVTIIGDHTNGIFSYTLDKKLPNGWEYCLSYQVYVSADMVCYEGKGVPVDIELFNRKADIEEGIDPRQISFTTTAQALTATWQQWSVATAAERLRQGQAILTTLSQARVGKRPDRYEPRAVKRRPKEYDRLMKPRVQARAELLHKQKR